MSGFWGLEVKPGAKPTPLRKQPGEMVMVLKQAALAPTGKLSADPSVLSVSVGSDTNERFVLCHLASGKCEQWAIDLGFGPDEEVNFHLTGKCAVHLTGFYEMDDDSDDEDEMDSEEEEMARMQGKAMEEEDDEESGEEEEGEEESGEEESEEESEERRIVELNADGKEVSDDGEEEEGESGEEEEEESGEEESGEEGEEGESEEESEEFTKEELAQKRKQLIEGMDMEGLGDDDDDDDDLDDLDDDEEDDLDDEEDEDDEEDDESEEEEEAPPPPSKKRQPVTPAASAKKQKTEAKPTPTPKQVAAAKAQPAGAGTPGAAGWTAAQEAALKKAAAATDASTPNRWAKVAEKVGGGKSKDACKKHFKELGAK